MVSDWRFTLNCGSPWAPDWTGLHLLSQIKAHAPWFQRSKGLGWFCPFWDPARLCWNNVLFSPARDCGERPQRLRHLGVRSVLFVWQRFGTKLNTLGNALAWGREHLQQRGLCQHCHGRERGFCLPDLLFWLCQFLGYSSLSRPVLAPSHHTHSQCQRQMHQQQWSCSRLGQAVWPQELRGNTEA